MLWVYKNTRTISLSVSVSVSVSISSIVRCVTVQIIESSQLVHSRELCCYWRELVFLGIFCSIWTEKYGIKGLFTWWEGDPSTRITLLPGSTCGYCILLSVYMSRVRFVSGDRMTLAQGSTSLRARMILVLGLCFARILSCKRSSWGQLGCQGFQKQDGGVAREIKRPTISILIAERKRFRC